MHKCDISLSPLPHCSVYNDTSTVYSSYYEMLGRREKYRNIRTIDIKDVTIFGSCWAILEDGEYKIARIHVSVSCGWFL